jgi:hypothetical protein
LIEFFIDGHLIETHFPGALHHVADPSYDKWKLARQIVDEKGVKWAIPKV